MRPKIYKTEEELRQAKNRISRNWYQKHKNDPEYKKLVKYRYEKYKRGQIETKEEFMREYNTDYVYYIRNVRTGKLEKRIAKIETRAEDLLKTIKYMKARLDYLLKKFGHLDHKEDNANANKN